MTVVIKNATDFNTYITEVEVILPQNVITKMTRTFATKKREFMKMRKHFILQQVRVGIPFNFTNLNFIIDHMKVEIY